MANTLVSIIICTRNRAEHLRETLESMARVEYPEGRKCEIVVVDNGSTDHTREVVSAANVPGIEVRYVREDAPGLSRARNRGLAESRGDMILFTDDDVRPCPDWVERMCRPIVGGRADAVAGGVVLAPHLVRPWMEPWHRAWLAETDCNKPDEPSELTGANMAFGRHILERVPAFDPELGAGALGFGEESLFSWQLSEAGYRIVGALDVTVVHHFEASRLLRSSWIGAAAKRGRVSAYHAYHWNHEDYWHPRRTALLFARRLAAFRAKHPGVLLEREGLSKWEMGAIFGYHSHLQFARERNRPRQYDKRGLVKSRLAAAGAA